MTHPHALSDEQRQSFADDGYLRLDAAFPRALADDARAILWRDLGLSPDDPAAWTEPVIRLGMYTQPPFVEAANTPRLHAAYDALVGPGRWQAPRAMGTFPVRFPSRVAAQDDGWHIDVSFGTEAPDFME